MLKNLSSHWKLGASILFLLTYNHIFAMEAKTAAVPAKFTQPAESHITIDCSPNPKSAKWITIHAPTPRITATVTSVGIKIKDKLLSPHWSNKYDLIKFARNNGIDIKTLLPPREEIAAGLVTAIFAKCFPLTHIQNENMFPKNGVIPYDIKNTLTCQEGEGIMMCFKSPYDSDPKKFVYHGKLILEYDNPNKYMESQALKLNEAEHLKKLLKGANDMHAKYATASNTNSTNSTSNKSSTSSTDSGKQKALEILANEQIADLANFDSQSVNAELLIDSFWTTTKDWPLPTLASSWIEVIS